MRPAAKEEMPTLAETRIRFSSHEWLISTRPPQLLNSTLHWASAYFSYDFRGGPLSSGYFRDAETGLDYAKNRYHQPGMGRFLTVDRKRRSARPTSPGSWNRYAYVGGDPINRRDPSGLCTVMAAGIGTSPDSSQPFDMASIDLGAVTGGRKGGRKGVERGRKGRKGQSESTPI
jgi:RHS repeat-associated protein